MSDRPVCEVIEHRRFLSVPAAATVRDAARLMRKAKAGAVMVVGTQHALIGICTERDVVLGAVAAGLDPDHTSVDVVMTEAPQCIGADQPFSHALHLMYEGGFHHVPVVDDRGRPVGILCARDAQCLDALQFEQELVRREEITVIL